MRRIAWPRGSAAHVGSASQSADVVVIGGGALGAATAHHLRRLGVADVVLLERDVLASGSTGKAAGGIRTQFADELLEEQEGKGYGEDEGERDGALPEQEAEPK